MKNFQGFSRFLSPKNTNIIFYFTLVATNPFALFLSKDNNIINSLFSLVRVHYTRYNRRMMDFPRARCQANLLHQQETIINRKYILFQGAGG